MPLGDRRDLVFELRTVHGGLDLQELRSLGILPEQVLDFSSNINPLGMSIRVKQALAQVDLSSYPDSSSLVLREALAARLNVDVKQLLIGNGSVQLIHLLARASIRQGQRCLIFTPTFGEYKAAASISGANIHFVWARETNGFRWSMKEATQAIESVRPHLVFLCNPNNPTGLNLTRDELDLIHTAIDKENLLVIDDSYATLSDRPWNCIPLIEQGNVAVLRSMTKEHAIAGARLGYLVAAPDVIQNTHQLQPAWSVNSVAQQVGLAVLEDDKHVEAARTMIEESKEKLYEAFRTLEIPVVESSTNFFLAKVGNAARVRSALLLNHIAVRECTSFGLPEHIRIAVRRPEECDRLVQSLREILANV